METVEKRQEDGVVYELEQYRQQNYNLLVPDIAVSGLSEFHKPVVNKVQLSADPKQGDVYYDNNARGLVVSGRGLSKLATCAGLVWDHDRCRRIDDRKDINYCAYRAVGGLRKPDGTIVWADASYDIDFNVLHDQMVESYTKKAREANPSKDQGWIDYCVNRDLQQKMTHKLKLCETGAKNRVTRKLLGIKTKYIEKELAKPFVMPSIVFQPDYSDRDVKMAMIQAHIQSTTGLYGPTQSAPQSPSHPAPEEQPASIPEADAGLDPDNPQSTSETTMESASIRQDFVDADVDNQVKTLKELVSRKGYNLNQLKKPLKDFTPEHRIGFYDKLMAMADDDTPY